MNHPLPREAREVLARLELVSNGCIYSYAPVASKGGFSGSEPVSGDRHPPHIVYREEFERATEDEFPGVLSRAQAELASLTRRSAPVRLETVQQRDRRMISEGAGFTVLEVATRFRCGPKDVRRVRRQAGRDTETGNAVLPVVAVDKREKVRELKARHPGMSNRQIAQFVSVDHKTVAAWLKAAA